jgi:hypothetical protein
MGIFIGHFLTEVAWRSNGWVKSQGLLTLTFNSVFGQREKHKMPKPKQEIKQ